MFGTADTRRSRRRNLHTRALRRGASDRCGAFAEHKSVGMETSTDEITTPSGPMGVHVVRPDGDGPFPVIVFFHHGPGLDEGSSGPWLASPNGATTW